MPINNLTARSIDRPTESDAEHGAARHAMIAQYSTLVKILAKRLAGRLPVSVTLDDLIGAGTLGLIRAADRFQASRGRPFEAYAKHRITGAMLDFLRGEDPLSRDQRKRARAAAGNTDTGPETISLERVGEPKVSGVCARHIESRLVSRMDLSAARKDLSPREDLVISLLLVGLTNRDVASRLGVTEGRVSQIKRAAFRKVRMHLLGAA